MHNVKAIFFDIDGTLLDTTAFIGGAYDHAFDQYGVPRRSWDDLVRQGSSATSLEDAMRMFAPDHDARALSLAFRQFQENGHEHIQLFPGVLETLVALKEANILISVLTNRSRSSLNNTLDALNFHGHFDAVFGGDDVPATKPSPEGVKHLITYFGINPEQAAMIGDADADILAGKGAGAKTVGVTYGAFGPDIQTYNPDYTVDDIRDILPLVTGGTPRTKEPIYVEAV